MVADGCDVVVNVPGWSTDVASLEGEVDVVVMQRPMHTRELLAVDRFQAGGAAVVIDLDDDLGRLSPRHPLFTIAHPKNSPSRNWKVLAECCRRADLVTVSTPALAERYGRHGRVAVIPNHVPAAYLEQRRIAHDGVWVGWTGAIGTHPNDLQAAGGAIGRVVGATGADFVVIGAERGVQQALSLPAEPWPFGWIPLPWYPVGMAQFDVGVVPLERSAFNEAKSYLKGLEFAALGVPFVASPTGPYRQLGEHCGILASKSKDWDRALKRLIMSPELRANEAGRAREWAATQTVERNASMWWSAWSQARATAPQRPVSLVGA